MDSLCSDVSHAGQQNARCIGSLGAGHADVRGITARVRTKAHNQAMHELSIICAVLEQLEELQQREGARISRVGLRVGELAGVDVDCLRFAFECAIKETQWESLALEIESVARRQRCPRCNFEFNCGAPLGGGKFPDKLLETFSGPLPFTACPECGEAATITIGGEELQIAYIEVETDGVEA